MLLINSNEHHFSNRIRIRFQAAPASVTIFLLLRLTLAIISIGHVAGAQSDFEIRLDAKKYVERGSTLLLRCENNVQPQILSKVSC